MPKAQPTCISEARRVRIKICGLSRMEDIHCANRARPDYIGFVFAESRRRVTVEKARELRERLDAGITPVGVFVDAEIGEIAALVNGRVIDMVQLHGNEDAAYIARLRERCGAPIIKAVRLGRGERPPDDAALRAAYGADYVLLDSGAGSGITFDWRLVERWTAASDFGSAFFLAGGINGNNIHRAVALAPFCVDVSSGAETDGIKDIEKMTALTASCHPPAVEGSNRCAV
jgi:phosphoribosylanthranilate isomerase